MRLLLAAITVPIVALIVAAVAFGYPPATFTSTPNSITVGSLECNTQYRIRVEEFTGGAYRDRQTYTRSTSPCPTPTPSPSPSPTPTETPTATPSPSPTPTPSPSPTPTSTPTPSPTPTPFGNFSVNAQGRIIDPDGNDFVPVGVNANGSNWVWNEPTVGQAANGQMARWHFNALRVNNCINFCQAAAWTTNNDLDALVQEYTSRKMVVILAQHQYGAGNENGGYAWDHYPELEAWWKTTAARYKDNPYVWFNPINEPTTEADQTGTARDASLARWYTVQTRLADAINSVAPDNMLVFDGHSYGQEKGTWSCTNASGTGWLDNSAILKYGTQLVQRYGLAMFDFHIYGQWSWNAQYGCGGPNSDPYLYWRADMREYLNRVRNQGLAIAVGEIGSTPAKNNEPYYAGGAWDAGHIFWQIAPEYRIGAFPWHGSSGTPFDILSPDYSWDEWTGDTSQFTWLGRGIYDYARTINP